MDFNLLQEHTVRLYDLKNHHFDIKTVNARELLSVSRFDLFAKLFYARHRNENPELARDVYFRHIKSFNPDGKEPGRTDKHSFDDFIQTYDRLLDYFKDHDFDARISVVPVSSNGIILDGAHRVAALAYYDKELTIAKFEDVAPVCQFDYLYFKQRGLALTICDIIAQEILYWKPCCYVACLWPRMGTSDGKEKARELLYQFEHPFYHRSYDVNLDSLTLFIAKVYRMQPWVGNEANHYAGAKDKALNCYKKGNKLDLYFFTSLKSLEDILKVKDDIRQLYPYGKHSIHITDNDVETSDVAFFSLTPKGREQWLYVGEWKGWQLVKHNFMERLYIFRHTYWIDFKVLIASFLDKLK